MASFPVLKTGASAQYGIERITQRPATVQRFLDGSTRRYPSEKGWRAWRVRLEGLSGQEAETVASFVETHFETQELFAFLDPWSGIEHDGCHVAEDGYAVVAEGEHGYRIEILIEQRQV
jgi:hypothetical protein